MKTSFNIDNEKNIVNICVVAMSTRFDKFGKQMIYKALSGGGPVETDAEVPVDTRRIDLWFMPDPARGGDRSHLGLLGRLTDAACTMEFYHCTPDGDELAGCMIKHGNFRHFLSLRSPELPIPIQWVISSGRPESGIKGLCFHAAPGWPSGIYGGPSLLWTWLVVVSELPVERDSLLLRLLGAGRVLQRAIAEVKELPPDAPERTLALPILVRLRLEVPVDPKARTNDDKEFLMETQDIVENWRREAVREGTARSVIDVYEARFGVIAPEFRAIIEETHDETTLRAWLRVVGTRSAEEIAAALRGSRAS